MKVSLVHIQVCIEFEKAFDTVDLAMLRKKLKTYGGNWSGT